MAYTFLDLKTKLTTQVGDPNLDSTVIADAINYTQQEIFAKYDLTLNSDSQTNTITSGTSSLASALPSDFQRISSIRVTLPVVNATDITERYMSPKEFRTAYPAIYLIGRPADWTFWTAIEFSTLADQTYTVKIDYIKSVPLLSATSDVPVIPQAFEEMLMLGAKIRIYEQKEDFDYASQFQNRFADLVEAFTTRYSTRQVDNMVIIPGARGRV